MPTTAQKWYDEIQKSNKDALLANQITVIPSVQTFASSGKDPMIGAYSSFVLVEEQQGAEACIANAFLCLDELLANIPVYRTKPQDYHFHGLIHTYPKLPSEGGRYRTWNEVRRFLDISHEILRGTPPFEVTYKGLVCSRDAVLLCGFADPALDIVRNRFFDAVERYPDAFDLIQQGQDPRQSMRYLREKYAQGAAHISAARFLGQLPNPTQFVDRAEGMKSVEIGKIVVDHFTFICNGWYDINNPQTSVRVRINLE